MTILTKEKLIELKAAHKTDAEIRKEFNLSRFFYDKIKADCHIRKHHTGNNNDEPFADYVVVMTDEQRASIYKGQRYDRG